MNKLQDWVEEHSDPLFQWAYYKTSKVEVAEDLVQDTFLAAAASFERFQGKSSPKTWLFSILNNKIVDYYRKQAKSILSLETEKERRGYEASEHAFNAEGSWKNIKEFNFWEDDGHLLDDHKFREILKYCMDKLPDNWRIIVTAKYLLEKPGKIICQEMEISPSNYWQILHRAKLVLKQCLEENWFNKE